MSTDTDPKCALLVMCGVCGKGVEAPLPLDRETLELFLAQILWFISVLTPPGHVPVLFSALCGDCARGAFPPEVLRAAEDRRQKLLQGIT